MIIIAGSLDLDPDQRETCLATAAPYIDAALDEPGCRRYEWTPDPRVPGRVWVYELWDDEASLRGHFEARPYADMGAHLGQHGLAPSFSISKFRVDLEEPVYDDTGTPRADFFTATD